jgi:glycosyltransferase involved in cell wall biosynthesis
LWYPWQVKVYLLEPYFTGSHRQWAEGLQRHSAHRISLLTHEGQFWKWRLQGGAVTMAGALAAAVEEQGPCDLILASSMLDLARLLGLAREAASGAAAAIYFHENQVTYPAVGRTRVEVALGLTNWVSLLAADGAAFNSSFHRDAFFSALPGFLRAQPDRGHEHLIGTARKRSAVVPVGVDLARIGALRLRSGPATVLWNHRWDPDKGIDEALAVLGRLAAQGADFRVVLAGEVFAGQAEQLAGAVEGLGDRVVHAGHLDEDGYVNALHAADVVVSTARHEFFGVSVVEAMYAGALPLLPSRLVYPERVPPGLEGTCLYRTRRGLEERLRRIIDDPGVAREQAAAVRGAVECFDWSVVAPLTDAWMESVVASRRS